jgi:DNA-binding beta-propeller fold protein YncE
VRAVEPTANSTLYLPLVSDPVVPSQRTPPSSGAWSSPIAISPADGSLWVVNPDAGSLSVIGGDDLKLRDEVQLAGEPWSLAFSPDGASLFVVDRAQGRLLHVDSATLEILNSVVAGSEPGALLLSADGSRAFVSLMAEAAVVAIDTTSFEIVDRIAVAPTPYALARSGSASHQTPEQLYVTHLFGFPIAGTVEAEDDSREGRVTVIELRSDTGQMQKVDEIILPPNERGLPNMMASIALHAGRAWIPHLRASPAPPNGMISTVFAAVSTLDLANHVELPAAALHLNDQETFGSPVNNPSAVAPSPDGKTLYLVHGGSDLLEVVDISTAEVPRLVKFLATGKNPRGIVLSADGSRAYIMNYLSRTVSVYNLDALTLISEITVTEETLAANVLAGKILFHNATDPRLTRGGWISCASCHFDGWPDGITWIYPDGLRQSPMLWNAAQTLPWHWSAALDEAQDVEETIHLIQHGLGLASGDNLYTLGEALAGESVALDQLAAFLLQGIRPVQLAVDERAAEELANGRALFVERGCNGCHGGATWTISALPDVPGTLDPDGDGMVNSVLRDVGTYSDRDVRGKGGFDVPSLLGVGLTAPYFHHGSAASLEDLLRSGHPLLHDELPPLDEMQIAELVQFLRSIGPTTEAVPAP